MPVGTATNAGAVRFGCKNDANVVRVPVEMQPCLVLSSESEPTSEAFRVFFMGISMDWTVIGCAGYMDRLCGMDCNTPRTTSLAGFTS